MKKNYFRGLVTALLTLSMSIVLAQTPNQRQKITKDYNFNVPNPQPFVVIMDKNE